MRLLPVHTKTFVRKPNYRIQYTNNYYISIEVCALQLAIYVSRINGLRMLQPWNAEWLDQWEELPKRKV